ncbi:MAG: hypothetical protein N4A72_08075 [Bacteroidales bacterium]|nr:hypothetical protein [Bacteroidales bacterium]
MSFNVSAQEIVGSTDVCVGDTEIYMYFGGIAEWSLSGADHNVDSGGEYGDTLIEISFNQTGTVYLTASEDWYNNTTIEITVEDCSRSSKRDVLPDQKIAGVLFEEDLSQNNSAFEIWK